MTEGTDRDGDRIIDDWYRVPQNHALQFQEVIQAGTAYTVTVHRPTVASEDQVTVTVPTCDGDGEASRDVSVRVRPDGMGVIPWGCDEDYTRRELEYVDPGEYTVDPPQETATTTET